MSRYSDSIWKEWLSFGCYAIFIFTLISLNESVSEDISKTDNLGWTYPSGDIILQLGQPLELFCTINPATVADLNFSIENVIFQLDHNQVTKSNVTKINGTTIRLYELSDKESKNTYACYLIANETRKSDLPSTTLWNKNETGPKIRTSLTSAISKRILVGANRVFIGTGPKLATNIACISYDWVKLNCSWTVPINYVSTNYTILYRPINGNQSQRKALACPSDDDIRHHFCVWTLDSEPCYERQYELMEIIIRGANIFNKTEQFMDFHHFEHVRPAGPYNLELLNRTSTSILLQWNIRFLSNFPKKWTYKISFREESKLKLFFCFPDMVRYNGGAATCNVTNLIPNSHYYFTVYMRSSVATSDNYWSKFSALNSVEFVTKNAPPLPPETNKNSFLIEHDDTKKSWRTVYIYWALKRRSSWEEYPWAKIEAFVINEAGGKYPDSSAKKEWETNKNKIHGIAKFVIGSSAYRFDIWSINTAGKSSNSSSIDVPAGLEEVKPCAFFYAQYYGKYVYELNWLPPSDISNIVNYTLFFCESEKIKKPESCYRNRHWWHESANGTRTTIIISTISYYGIYHPPPFHFAISINTNTSCSDFLWTTDTVLQFHELKDDLIGLNGKYERRLKLMGMNTSTNTFMRIPPDKIDELTLKSMVRFVIKESKLSDTQDDAVAVNLNNKRSKHLFEQFGIKKQKLSDTKDDTVAVNLNKGSKNSFEQKQRKRVVEVRPKFKDSLNTRWKLSEIEYQKWLKKLYIR